MGIVDFQIEEGTLTDKFKEENDRNRILVVSDEKKFPPAWMPMYNISITYGQETANRSVPFEVPDTFVGKRVTLIQKYYSDKWGFVRRYETSLQENESKRKIESSFKVPLWASILSSIQPDRRMAA